MLLLTDKKVLQDFYRDLRRAWLRSERTGGLYTATVTDSAGRKLTVGVQAPLYDKDAGHGDGPPRKKTHAKHPDHRP